MSLDAGRPGGGGIPLGQNYVLHEELGRGAMGRVHRATRRDTGAEVAAKLLWPHLAGDPEIVARFLRERLILTKIKDPHLVPVLDLVAESDTLAIISERVRGPNLRTYLQERVRLELSGAQPVARLTDFGIARLAEGPSLTKVGGSLGTPEYGAPELAKRLEIGPAADVYSAGVMLYELLFGAGEFPAVPETGRDNAAQPKPQSWGLPEALWSLMASMLVEDADERPAARATAAALEALSPSLTSRQPQPPTKRRRAASGDEPRTLHRGVRPEVQQEPRRVRPTPPPESPLGVPPRPV